jgi:hypothetical protein
LHGHIRFTLMLPVTETIPVALTGCQFICDALHINK